MCFGHKSPRCRKAGPYVDLLDLVDEFRLGPAGRVYFCTLGSYRHATSPDPSLFGSYSSAGTRVGGSLRSLFRPLMKQIDPIKLKL